MGIFQGAGPSFLLVLGWFFVKEVPDMLFPPSFLLSLCIGKHQNCMEHGLEKKFP